MGRKGLKSQLKFFLSTSKPRAKRAPQLREQTHTSSVLVLHSGLEP
jgi:hypothetical protein